MKPDNSPLMRRANELIADLEDLEQDLETNENSHYRYFKAAQEIKAKRQELETIRSIVEASAQ
jgi:hypothetical protein